MSSDPGLMGHTLTCPEKMLCTPSHIKRQWSALHSPYGIAIGKAGIAAGFQWLPIPVDWYKDLLVRDSTAVPG